MNDILSPDKNPAYGDWTSLPASFWDELESIGERGIEADSRIIKDSNGGYRLPFLGEILLVHATQRRMTWLETERSPTFQEGLVALSYLRNLKPIDLSRKWVSPRELPGGRTFFGPGSHPPKTDGILTAWAKQPERFHSIVKILHVTPIPQGDEGIQIPCLPKVPLRYIFWEGEPALPCTVTLLINATAHLFLSLDVLWALINLTDQRFEILE